LKIFDLDEKVALSEHLDSSGYNIIQKFGVSKILFLKKVNAFIQQGCIKLIRRDSKDIYSVTEDLYFKEMLSF